MKFYFPGIRKYYRFMNKRYIVILTFIPNTSDIYFPNHLELLYHRCYIYKYYKPIKNAKPHYDRIPVSRLYGGGHTYQFSY